MPVSFHNVLINFLAGAIFPTLLFMFYLFDIVAFTTLKVFTLIFIVIFVLCPLIFKYSYKFQSSVVFLNFLHVPSDADYEHPQKYGLEGARNFYLLTNDNIKIGIWQILPDSLNHSNETNDQYFEEVLGDGQNVIVYYHGNAGTRLTGHRVELYKVLRKHFHVFAFDYRSYGDSSNVDPSEPGIVNDCMFVFKWVANKTKGHIFIWGHSLGTSLATHSLALLQGKGYTRRPTGVILEAPFNNMREEISEFPLARIFKKLPWFSYTIVEPMQENGFTFQTDKYICYVDAPIIILHAKDDHVVPYKLGYKLYQQAMGCRKETQGKLSFLKFDGGHNYDHKYICRAPEIHDIISNFISEAIEESKQKQLVTI